MTPEQRALASQVLYQHVVDYWHQVDLTGGAGVSAMYVEDGTFHAGPGKALVGRAAIEQFYSWRQDRGARTSRHVVTNFRAEFSDANNANTYCIMQLFAADGKPILPAAAPILIADQVDRFRKDSDGLWRVVERNFIPLFMGGNAPTVPPESIAEKFNTDQKKG
jgi:hypothetical protein